MRLHGLNIPSLRQNLNQIVTGEEAKSRESSTLGVKVVIKTLLDLLEPLVVLLEPFEDAATVGLRNDFWIFLALNHVVFPEFVDLLELFCLRLQLSLNVLSIEDIFQIHPLTLEAKPLIDGITNVAQLFLPLFDFNADLVNESGAHHTTDSHDVIFKVTDNFFNFFDDESILRVTVG